MDDSPLPLILEQARRFGSRELDAAAIDEAADIPAEVIAMAARQGLFGLTVPEEHGGLGMGLGEACAVVAELARWDRSVATTVGLHLGLGTRALVELSAPALRERWLPRIAEGEVVAAFCATEPAAGSDLTRVQTTARVEGDELVIDGEKSFVTNGGFAGIFTVLARTPGLGGTRATSLLCVPRDTAGISYGPEEHKLGIRGSSTVTVRFDGARIPMDHVLGEPGKGLDAAHRSLEWGRTIMSAGCIGTARAALDATLLQVQARKQFGRALVKLGGVQEQVARMASLLFAMEATVEHVGDVEREGGELGLPASVAKVLCSEGAFEICDRAIQLHGGLGFIEETGVALLARDCRVTRIFEGTNDVLLIHLGTALVATSEGLPGARIHGEVEAWLSDASEVWAEAAERFSTTATQLRKEHGISIVRRPLMLTRLARAHVCLSAASAAISRAARMGRSQALRAERATRSLVRESLVHLDSLGAAAEDAERDRVLVEQLTGADEASDAPPRRASQEVTP